VGLIPAAGKPVPGELLIRGKTPGNSRLCYHGAMRDLVLLFIHLIATFARFLGPGGLRSVMAESLLAKQQLLILNRSRQRSPHLRTSDRLVAGWCALLIRPARLIRSAIVLKPSTLLSLHHALKNRKYRVLRNKTPKVTWLLLIPEVIDSINRRIFAQDNLGLPFVGKGQPGQVSKIESGEWIQRTSELLECRSILP